MAGQRVTTLATSSWSPTSNGVRARNTGRVGVCQPPAEPAAAGGPWSHAEINCWERMGLTTAGALAGSRVFTGTRQRHGTEGAHCGVRAEVLHARATGGACPLWADRPGRWSAVTRADFGGHTTLSVKSGWGSRRAWTRQRGATRMRRWSTPGGKTETVAGQPLFGGGGAAHRATALINETGNHRKAGAVTVDPSQLAFFVVQPFVRCRWLPRGGGGVGGVLAGTPHSHRSPTQCS